jgi:hypothetical protein
MAFNMTYDDRNRREIATLAPNTKVAANKWYDYCIKHEINVLITQGIRDMEEQKRNVAKGASQTLRSYHLVGQAFDFVPIINGKACYDLYKCSPWKESIVYAKSIGFDWGGDWKAFQDMPHLEYEFKGYGTDKVMSVPVKSAEHVKPVKKYTSLVDYLNANKKPSGFNDRLRLAATYGIYGYQGTAEQNTLLLKKLQG